MDAGQLAYIASVASEIAKTRQDEVVRKVGQILHDLAFVICSKATGMSPEEYEIHYRRVIDDEAARAKAERETGIPFRVAGGHAAATAATARGENIGNSIRRLATEIDTTWSKTDSQLQELIRQIAETGITQIDPISSASFPSNRGSTSLFFGNINQNVYIPGVSNTLSESNAPISLSVVSGADGSNFPPKSAEQQYKTRGRMNAEKVTAAVSAAKGGKKAAGSGTTPSSSVSSAAELGKNV